MSIEPIYQELSPITLPLNQIYLDPNNPRFIDSNWLHIPVDDADKPDVQATAQRRLVHNFDADKLRMSMEVNGYLPIDRAVVKKVADNKYVVLEGNRRICAAKMIVAFVDKGGVVHPRVVESLKDIPCLLYTGADSDAAWIFQGLRHISGVVEWSAFNKAKLLVEQMEAEGLSLTEVGKRFGLTPHGTGQWVRGYRAFTQARESSDYINEVDERAYPYFQELFSRSSAPVREWMGWDEREEKFEGLLNFNEFVGWLYPKNADGDTEDNSGGRGDFEKRRLVRRDDIRTLAFLLSKAPEYFTQFRSGTELERVYSLALVKEYEEEARKAAEPIDDTFSVIDQCRRMLDNLPYKALRNPEIKTRLLESLSTLEKSIQSLKES